MITFTKLGAYGRLGNQLFQIAGTIGIALRNQTDYLFPQWESSHYYQTPIPQVDIDELLKLDLKLYNAEEHFHYQPVTLDQQSDWDIGGYLQTEKYFQHCAGIIRNHLRLKDELNDSLRSKYAELLQSECCSIHVRRGDYVGSPDYHPVLPMHYYDAAMAHFPAGTIFPIFSDDIEWCRQSFQGHRFVFIEESDPVLSMHLISLARHHIIANSSFSWWGAWLNEHPDKRVIAPSLWFGERYTHLDTSDLVPEGWIKI